MTHTIHETAGAPKERTPKNTISLYCLQSLDFWLQKVTMTMLDTEKRRAFFDVIVASGGPSIRFQAVAGLRDCGDGRLLVDRIGRGIRDIDMVGAILLAEEDVDLQYELRRITGKLAPAWHLEISKKVKEGCVPAKSAPVQCLSHIELPSSHIRATLDTTVGYKVSVVVESLLADDIRADAVSCTRPTLAEAMECALHMSVRQMRMDPKQVERLLDALYQDWRFVIESGDASAAG